MEREHVVKLFKEIKNIYPTFEVSTEKVNTWARMMKKMDNNRVMAKLEEHSLVNKFPPTIAEISAYAPEKNEHLEKMRQWEKEAAKVPQSVKDDFRKQMKKLFQEKSQ